MLKKPQRVEEETKNTGGGPMVATKKVTPVEIRLKSDFAKYQPLPNVKMTFPVAGTQQKIELEINMTKEDGYWRGGIYKFTVDVPDSYPHHAPKVHLITPIYHPNIDTEGNVCLNILRKDWTPVFSIQTVVFGVLSLFFSPEPTDPLNHQAAAMQRDNLSGFIANVTKSLKGGTVDGITYPKFIWFATSLTDFKSSENFNTML